MASPLRGKRAGGTVRDQLAAMFYEGLVRSEDPEDHSVEFGEPPLRPHEGPQTRFLETPADIAFYGGEAGGGKSYGLLMEACRHSDVPDFHAVIFRRTSPRITQEGGLWDTSFQIYPELGAEPYQSPSHEWRFPSGAKVAFHHMQHEKDRLEWKSSQIPLIGWDQVEEFTERQFWYLTSRNRSTCGVRPYVRATCNPVPPEDEIGGWLHELLSWWIGDDGYPIEERDGVLRWFLRFEGDLQWFDSEAEAEAFRGERGMDERIRPRSVTFIRAQLEDNPTLMREDPSYLSVLEALPKVDRDRLRGGNWLVRETAGRVFDRTWFDIVDAAPAEAERVRYWDAASSEREEGASARSAGVKMSKAGDTYYIEDVTEGFWSGAQREKVQDETAEEDGVEVSIWLEQEPGSSGKDVALAAVARLSGYDVHRDKVTGDKVARAKPMSAQAEVGNVKLVRGPWNESLLRQLQRFERGAKLIDAADAAVGAFNRLTVRERGREFWFR